MIGVVARDDQRGVVEELFELFKTPWEPYRPDRRYDVVITTVDVPPHVHARLLIVCGPEVRSTDARSGSAAGIVRRRLTIEHDGFALPIYGDALTLGDTNAVVAPFSARFGAVGQAIRVGYDLFDEVRHLLTAGQPVEHAAVPSLDIHIARLRGWILAAGLPLVEIPPAPPGQAFLACLTHDIDFVGIRNHRFDHTMLGFLWRSTVGAVGDLLRRRISIGRALTMWRAVLSLPFVYLGWARDFWEPFEWYRRVERGMPSTFFVIPFKRRPGIRVPAAHARRRASAYDVMDVRDAMHALMSDGCEIGVHGIDAWHSAARGREEAARIRSATGSTPSGTRSHWLLHDDRTPAALEAAGYEYDSTMGFNETVGYRAGTVQVFRPLETRTLLELPLHVQDGALFYRHRLDLSERDAAERCQRLIAWSTRAGGVLTVLWHDRSHAPERLWGDFYVGLLGDLKAAGAYFATASQTVDWFRRRRSVSFEPVDDAAGVWRVSGAGGDTACLPLSVRVHQSPVARVDIPWSGASPIEVDVHAGCAIARSPEWSAAAAIGSAS